MQPIQISIPQPCHEDWQKMTAAEQGKFCGACQKTVVDFSTMSDGEIVRLFEEKKGKLCGRFTTTQLERPIEPTKIYKTNWFKWVMQLIVPMVVFTKTSFGQKKGTKQPVTNAESNMHITMGKPAMRVVKKDTSSNLIDSVLKNKMPSSIRIENVNSKLLKGDTIISKGITNRIEGKIVDELGIPIPNATIHNKSFNQNFIADSTGYFSVEIKKAITDRFLHISSVGFEDREIQIAEFDEQIKTIALQKISHKLNDVIVRSYNTHVMGRLITGYSIIGYSTTKTKNIKTKDAKQKITFPLTQTNQFTIFPNPIPSGQILNISATVKNAGVYYLELISTNGELLLAKEVRLSTTNEKIELPTSDDWAAGTYFLRILDADKKFVFNSKVVIL
jgi:CarboxypepD_reg-like domain